MGLAELAGRAVVAPVPPVAFLVAALSRLAGVALRRGLDLGDDDGSLGSSLGKGVELLLAEV